MPVLMYGAGIFSKHDKIRIEGNTMRVYERFDKTSENREPQRAYYIPYNTLEKALEGRKETSAYYRLLNGKRNFKYFTRDIDVPDQILDWDWIDVPSCWQTQKWGCIKAQQKESMFS